jgi:hypothetical protein
MAQDLDKTERSEAVSISAEPNNAESLGAESPPSGGLTEDDDEHQKLPFSKARCIALVATVTGASFLNVSLLCMAPLYSFSCVTLSHNTM